MKKLFITIAVGLFAMISWSQTEQGNYLIGASSNLNFSSLETEIEAFDFTNSQSQFSLTAEGGYFLANNFATGIGLGYTRSESEGLVNRTLVIAPFAKYYFLDKNIRPFLRASYGFGSGTSDAITAFPNTTEIETDISSFELGAGVAFFINEMISIELGLSYISQSITSSSVLNLQDQEQTQKGFISGVGFVIFL